jgi:porin
MKKQSFMPDCYGQIGTWDVKPESLMTKYMVYFSTLGSTGVIIPVQIGFDTNLVGLDLLGDYVIGGFYATSTILNVVNKEIPREGRFSGYAYLMQAVYKNPNDPQRSLSLFATVVGADSKTSFAPGLMDKSTFPGRDADGPYVSAYATTRNNCVAVQQATKNPTDDYTELTQYRECGINIAYSVGLAPWLWVSLNLEYIINPSAFSGKVIYNGTVPGVETSVNF